MKFHDQTAELAAAQAITDVGETPTGNYGTRHWTIIRKAAVNSLKPFVGPISRLVSELSPAIQLYCLHPSTSPDLSSFLPTFSTAHWNRRTARWPSYSVLAIELRPGFKF